MPLAASGLNAPGRDAKISATPAGPEALAGGPIGRLRDGDRVSFMIDPIRLEGTVDLVGEGQERFSPEEGERRLAKRPTHPGLTTDDAVPEDTRLWALLQAASGGTWGGCVYDYRSIADRLASG